MALLKKWVVIGDPHGDEIDPVVETSLFNFLDDYKPDIVVHGGDNWNLPQLRKKASQKEKDESMADDWLMGSDFLSRFLSYGTTRYFLRGNHDERLWDLQQEGTGDQRQHADNLIKEVNKIVHKRMARMLPYDSRKGVLEIPGMPRVIHGYAAGDGSAKLFASIYGTCIFCHTHAADVGVAKRWPRPSLAFGTGCLCRIDQPYNSRNTGKLRHENCWTYGYSTSGEPEPVVLQARRIGDHFYAATEIKTY